MKIRRNQARDGEAYKELLKKKGFVPVRFGVPSPVGRVVKGTLVMCSYAGKKAWWLLRRIYIKKEDKYQ